MEKKYAGLILAAGYSSRMGETKALLCIGEETLVEHQIRCFVSAGINDIFIVVGHGAEHILKTVKQYPVKTVYNENYPDGMFTSVQAGARAIREGDFDGVFLLPVDYVLTQPFTIEYLAQRFEQGGAGIVYPCYKQRKGHPPLFASALLEEIIAAEPDAGLKSIFERHKDEAAYLEMGNTTCLIDIDTQQDYAKALAYIDEHAAPDMEECDFIYKHYNVSEPIIEHCAKVAGTAKIIAEALKNKGYDIDPELVFYGGFLHDIRKGAHDHAAKAAQAVSAMGYPKIAQLIANHMDIDKKYATTICSESVLYFADKITVQNETVCIEQRFSLLSEKYGGDNTRMLQAQKRLQIASHIQSLINAALGADVMQIL